MGDLRTHRFLKLNGYRLVRRVGNNGWYVPANAPLRASVSERWEIVRKYYVALPFRMARNASRRYRRYFFDWWSGR